MGSHLDERYSDAMVTFGFSFYQGSLSAINHQRASESWDRLISHEALLPVEGSYEHMLGAVGLPQMFLDLHRRVQPQLTGWPGLAFFNLARNFICNIHLPEYNVIIHLQ